MTTDRYANLHHVGTGPKFYSPGKSRQPWRPPIDLIRLEIGDSVDVLLDDGRIVRTTVRGPVADLSGHYSAWVEGITGSYALHRIRRAGGWADVPGVAYAVGGAS